MTRSSSFGELVSSLSDDEFESLALSVAERRCRDELGFGTYAEAAALFRPNPPCPDCGHGKPSSKRMRKGPLGHIAEGSVIVHDMEKAHNALIKAAKCTSEAYRADARDPVYLECMSMVNSLCSWLKRYLWRFTGMKPKNLQSYLNWFVYLFRVHQAEEKWPKTERVVRHLLMTESRYRSSRA